MVYNDEVVYDVIRPYVIVSAANVQLGKWWNDLSGIYSRSSRFAGTLNRPSSTSQSCSLDEVLIARRYCSPFAVDYTALFSTTTVNHCKCMVVRFIGRLSVMDDYHGEHCQ